MAWRFTSESISSLVRRVKVGKFQNDQVMPQDTHFGYVEGYLDALEKVESFHKQHPHMSTEDICFALKTSIRTVIVAGGIITIPDDVTSFPAVAQLLQKTVGLCESSAYPADA